MLATRTFLFSDLREYTQFVQRHGDAAAKQLITDYRRIVRAEIAKHEGAEIKTEGDSFYVVFPGAHAAVSAASAILREADRYSRRQPERPMRIGVGIHAGEPQPHEGQYVGSAVIVAARLAQSASAGDLLISDLVRGLLPQGGMPAMEERTGLVLKGLDEPPRVYAVRWPRDAAPREPAAAAVSIPAAEPGSRQVLCPEIVGRDRELAALENFLAQARAGRGRTVLLAGEAGLGKSALLRRFSEVVREDGVRLLAGECTEIEARRPFGPFIDALASAGIPLPAELGQGGPGAQPVAETERYRVHAGFAERIATACAEQPLVLTIEDLHWGDEATYELVPYLARKLRDRPVLLLATYRSDELHRTHPFNHVLAELTRARLADEVRLRRLSTAELADMVRLTLGLSRPPTREFVDALYARTEGNPFFVEEILRALVERGDLEYREGAWRRTKEVADLTIPVSVRDAVQQRLLTMPSTARRVLQVAAVIGQRFEFELLREVAQADAEAAFEAIRAGIDAQLLFEEETAEREAYRFRHALSREAVLADLLQRERRLLHRAVGEAIERAAPDAVEELAYHFDQARDPRAFRYHELAAEASARQLAFAPAAQHFDRAVELAPDDEPRLGQLQLRLSDMAFSADDHSRALQAAEAAGRTFAAAGDDAGSGEALWRESQARWMFGETVRARELLDEARALLEQRGVSATLAAVYGQLARLAMLDRREPEAIVLSRRGIEMAQATGAREAEISARTTLGTSLAHVGDAAGLVLLRESIDLAKEHGLVSQALRGYNNLYVASVLLAADYAQATDALQAFLAYATAHGLRPETLEGQLVREAFMEGDWDRALAGSEASRSETIWATSRSVLASTIRIARDGPSPVLFEALEAARRRLLAAGDSQWVLNAAAAAASYARAGRCEEALERGEAAREVFSSQLAGPVLAFLVVDPLVRCAIMLGTPDRAEPWLALVEGTSHSWARPAARAFARAVRHEIAGDREAARAAYREAARLAATQWPLGELAAGARYASARLGAALGDLAGAGEDFAWVREFWQRRKAAWYLGELEREAREAGIPVD